VAQLTAQEFTDLITTLIDHMGMAQFHTKLLRANALVSRKRPKNSQALAHRLYQLSAGLRRDHAARYAVEVLWQEMVSSHIKEEHTKTVEALAERVNACLTERLEVVPDKKAQLLSALGAYYQAVAALTSHETAHLEMLMRATTSVAEFLREHKSELTAMESATPQAQTETVGSDTVVESD
jgi:hemoglobin-like flavoprotein